MDSTLTFPLADFITVRYTLINGYLEGGTYTWVVEIINFKIHCVSGDVFVSFTVELGIMMFYFVRGKAS
jgi:hypothetical protein